MVRWSLLTDTSPSNTLALVYFALFRVLWAASKNKILLIVLEDNIKHNNDIVLEIVCYYYWMEWKRIYWSIYNLDWYSGAAAAVCAAGARGAGDEAGHHVAGGGAVPQNIHQETRECQVHRPGFTRYFYFLSNIFAAFFLHRILSRYLWWNYFQYFVCGYSGVYQPFITMLSPGTCLFKSILIESVSTMQGKCKNMSWWKNFCFAIWSYFLVFSR